MNRNIISGVKGGEELGGIRQDVNTNHKVRGCHIVGIQELNKGWGGLHNEDKDSWQRLGDFMGLRVMVRHQRKTQIRRLESPRRRPEFCICTLTNKLGDCWD